MKQKVQKERVKKQYAEDGTRSQKPFTFRVDNEVQDWLDQQCNKGRYINNLIAADMAKRRSR